MTKRILNRIKCKGCGKEFTSVWNAKYCSERCKTIAKEKWFKKYRAQHRSSYLKLRFEIFKRDNFTCQYCGRSPKKHGIVLVVDHTLPKCKGGTNNPKKLITSCEECNLGKGDVLLIDRLLNKKKKEE